MPALCNKADHQTLRTIRSNARKTYALCASGTSVADTCLVLSAAGCSISAAQMSSESRCHCGVRIIVAVVVDLIGWRDFALLIVGGGGCCFATSGLVVFPCDNW